MTIDPGNESGRSTFAVPSWRLPAAARWGAIGGIALILGLIFSCKTAILSKGLPLTIHLSRCALTVLEFPSKRSTTTALIVFASGDGGWGRLEESICRAFQKQGYEVIGINSVVYAKTDYDADILQKDFATVAQAARAPFGKSPPPLILGGYSMGAAQAIAAAGGPHPPPGVVGLLLIDPLSRGRYGLRSADQLNVLPTGEGTFSVDSFSKSMKSLRIVQWHAEDDSIDSRDWLQDLTAPHESFTFSNTGHAYDFDRGSFIRQLVDSAGWILKKPIPGGKNG
jgi:hypothetical protein